MVVAVLSLLDNDGGSFFRMLECMKARNFSPWRNPPSGSSFQRSSKIYECDTNGVRYGPLSVVIPFLTALRAQPARIPLMFY